MQGPPVSASESLAVSPVFLAVANATVIAVPLIWLAAVYRFALVVRRCALDTEPAPMYVAEEAA